MPAWPAAGTPHGDGFDNERTLAVAKDTKSTVAAMLSGAPTLAPVADPPGRGAQPPAPRPAAPVADVDEDDLDDSDLEAFDLQVDRPLVRPRRRAAVDYQTVRINRPTAKILRQQWLMARRLDPLLSFTEFATIVAQKGLTALAEERRRESAD